MPTSCPLGRCRYAQDEALLPLALSTGATLPPAGGANCTADVRCNAPGGNTCLRGVCSCVGAWRGPACSVQVRCSAWEAISSTWRDCLLTEVDGAAHCRCETHGEIAVRHRSWEPNLTWLDFSQDWTMLLGFGKSASALSLFCGFLGTLYSHRIIVVVSRLSHCSLVAGLWLLVVTLTWRKDRSCLWSAEPLPPWTSSSLNFREMVIEAHSKLAQPDGVKRRGYLTR